MTEPAARELVLRRIRTALGVDGADGVDGEPVPRHYRSEHRQDPAERLAVFEDRLVDYGATVKRCTPDQIAATVSALLGSETLLLVPHDLDRSWLPASWPANRLLTDDGTRSADQIDQADSVLTAAAAGIAETGTIVLDGGAGQGRRLLSLLPDHHLCVVAANQIVGGVPEAIRRLNPGRPLTWISGPSATSDIELSRVQGVHGPRRLDVLLVAGNGEPEPS